MRWLVAHPGPQFSVQDLYDGWCEALTALGQDVHGFNLGDRLTFYGSVLVETSEAGVFRRALTTDQVPDMALNGLYAALYKTRPDVLLVVSGFFTPPALLEHVRRSGTRVVVLHTEAPYEDDRQLALAEHADLNLVNDRTTLPAYMAAGPSVYMPHAYRPSVHRRAPAEPDLACDLAFVGTGYPSRIEFLERMDLDGLDVLLAGNWQALREDSPLRKLVGHDVDECLPNSDAVRVYSSARAGLNLYRREAEEPGREGWAMGPREVEMAACGLWFARDPRGEGDEVLPMLPTFTCPGEAGDVVRWWLGRDAERAEAAREARAAVADRTFEAGAARVLRLLDG